MEKLFCTYIQLYMVYNMMNHNSWTALYEIKKQAIYFINSVSNASS